MPLGDVTFNRSDSSGEFPVAPDGTYEATLIEAEPATIDGYDGGPDKPDRS
jgi:hypothetical protein